MSPRRLGLVFNRDLAHNGRRVLTWIWVALLVLLAWGLSTGSVRIQSGDSGVGGTKAYITSEFAVTQFLVILTPLVYGFFASVVAGMAVIQDDECRVGEVLHASPLRPGEYVWGKFLAVLATSAAVLALHVGAMILFNHGTPAGEAQEFRGPFLLAHYVRPALIFALPTIVFFAGVSFYVGERTRKPILVFALPVVMFLACIFLFWDFAPTWLDPRLDRAMMMLDPAGFRWMNETLLKVDRGVRFYNTASVPLDGWIVANRLLFTGLGLLGVALSARHLGASLRGSSPRAEAAWKASANARAEAASEAIDVATSMAPASRPLAPLGMTARRPGLIRGAWAVTGAEFAELRSSPGLFLFVPLLVLQAALPALVLPGPFDTPLLLTSGTFAARTLNPLTLLLCLLLLFYTVESLWRERHTRLAAISFATPVRTGSILIGKALANALVGVAVIGVIALVGVGSLVYQRAIYGVAVPVESVPFALVWGLMLVPTLFLWTSFVMAALALTRNRYATYALALVVLGFTGYRRIIGEMNWVGNWTLWGVMPWSDLSILEFDRTALILNRALALGLAGFFIVLTVRLFGRRDADAAGTWHRLRPMGLLRTALLLVPAALVPFVAGAILWAQVDSGFQGKGTEKLAKDYWRKNLATYRDWPLPDITAADVAVDIEPASRRLEVAGTYDLINNQDVPLRQIPLTGGLHWKSPQWTADGEPAKLDNRSGLHVYTPETPIPPGGTFRLGFKFAGTFPAGITKNGGGNNEFILPSGVVLTSFGPSFAPVLGFSEGIGVDKDNRYETRDYPDDYFEGQTESFAGSRRPFTTRVTISGPADLVYNSVGTLASEVVKGGRRTAVWESDKPVNFFNIVAGKWAVARGQGTAIYHSPKHPYNIAEMVEALDAARKYYSEWFRPYPWKELKLSEFPALANYAQGFPTDITFSESIGFLTLSGPEANSAFMVTAHESAHQWWGNMVAPGKGPGGNLLSEGTSHFSTLLLFEQVKGLKERIAFARKIEDSYAKGRSADSERPLVKIDGSRDGDQVVTYDKAGFVFWMLLNHMGRERMLEGIRDFFERYHANPDHPVLQDFLAVLRPHAADGEAFDAFTKQWFFEVVLPEYQLEDAKKAREGDKWVVTARLRNNGTGAMPVEIAASRGERFPSGSKATNEPKSFREVRQTVTPGANESADIRILCDFEPQTLTVDPDVKVLMLRRKAATKSF